MTQKDKDAKDEKAWSEWVNMYMKRIKSEAVNEASLSDWNSSRIKLMNQNNPKFILRNYIAQQAIKLAEDGDFTEVNKVLDLLTDPYDEITKTLEVDSKPGPSKSCRASGYSSAPPNWAYSLKVT
ncbi:Selenoprotein O [Nymphon striatum]|nr:Selenoprotein O [Nymphon striatum]